MDIMVMGMGIVGVSVAMGLLLIWRNVMMGMGKMEMGVVVCVWFRGSIGAIIAMFLVYANCIIMSLAQSNGSGEYQV